VKVKLPSPAPLSCPACGLALQLAPEALQQLKQVRCPRCAASNAPYFWLNSSLRQEISSRIRNRMYFDAYQFNQGESAPESEK
jgi:hypothetical protein